MNITLPSRKRGQRGNRKLGLEAKLCGYSRRVDMEPHVLRATKMLSGTGRAIWSVSRGEGGGEE